MVNLVNPWLALPNAAKVLKRKTFHRLIEYVDTSGSGLGLTLAQAAILELWAAENPQSLKTFDRLGGASEILSELVMREKEELAPETSH